MFASAHPNCVVCSQLLLVVAIVSGQIPVARSRSPGDVAADTEQLLAVTLIERIACSRRRRRSLIFRRLVAQLSETSLCRRRDPDVPLGVAVIVFTAPRCASAVGIRCRRVLSVCLSVRHKPALYRNDWTVRRTELVFGTEASCHLS